MPRPTRIYINLKAMRQNLRYAIEASKKAKVMAVVKANAYGHGLFRILPALEDADALALLELDSAVALRRSGYKKPIILLEGFFEESELEVFSKESLTAVVHHVDQVEMLLRAKMNNPIGVFLKINSGMNRLGLRIDAGETSFRSLRDSANISSVVIMTHFADADGPSGINWQYERFQSLSFHQEQNLLTSLGNSATILRYPECVGDWARPGIMLYGSTPFEDDGNSILPIKPVMSLTSEVIARQEVNKGESVGYGCDYIATKNTVVGIVACGYGDGYPRTIAPGTYVLIGKYKAFIIGRISMDLLAIDMTGVPEEEWSKPVVMWGPDLPIEIIARAAGTISYDLMCRVNSRVPVRIVEK